MAADILVVDDEADIREIVAGILDDEGHSARTAGDSDSALAAISARRPSLLFLDIWLQGSRLDGLSLLDEVHASIPNCRSSSSPATATSRRRFRPSSAAPTTTSRSRSRRTVSCWSAQRALEASKLKREIAELKHRAGDSEELIGVVRRDEPSAADDRASRADEQPRHDLRAVGRRQGAGRADDPQRSQRAAGRSSC